MICVAQRDGFTDGEGSFTVSILKDDSYKTGWQVRLSFEIHLHEKDRALLEEFITFFDVGKIYTKSKGSISYLVSSVKDLQVILEHFEKYPLLTKKRADFELWAQILYLVQNKEHNTLEGLTKIVALKASLNKGLNDKLKAAFPTIVAVERSQFDNALIQDPNWVAGFTSGEGCFLVSIFKSNTLTGFAVKLRFNLIQHSRDTQLMKSLVDYLGCGRYVTGPEGYNHCEFIVSNLSDITKTIIPFFEKYSIRGNKLLDFSDFCKVAKIMENKAHLTTEGLDKIHLIKASMNRGRKI